ncbi:MAG: cisplatin damage response ATP-dependent DNA ligase, partial [Pseudomonadota bacterium]
KWDGIRAQLICRGGRVVLWSRGEERLDGRFPELEAAARALPDGTVLDGEILAYEPSARKDDEAAAEADHKKRDDNTSGDPAAEKQSTGRHRLSYTFAALQRRIGRKKPSAAMLAAVPVDFMAYDLLEAHGVDWRARPLRERRTRLEAVLADQPPPLRLSESVTADSWPQLAALREESRSRGVEGLMLKARESAYGTGRQRGSWWKWKIDPLTVDAVLLYAQPGSGRRSNLLTDYTFGVWSDGELVTVCKAYSGLDNDEIGELDRWIRAHTTERFGPVRAVEPELVFEIAFEGVWPSKRHKAGVAFRFPRILRWRRDLKLADADSLETVRSTMAFTGARQANP